MVKAVVLEEKTAVAARHPGRENAGPARRAHRPAHCRHLRQRRALLHPWRHRPVRGARADDPGPRGLGRDPRGRRRRDRAQGRRPGLHGAGHPRPRPAAPRRLGIYNLDPAVRFWATPPVHGILRPTVVHPADFTFKLPDNVSLPQAAMVEPLAPACTPRPRRRSSRATSRVVTGAGADRPCHPPGRPRRRLRARDRQRRGRRQARSRRKARRRSMTVNVRSQNLVDVVKRRDRRLGRRRRLRVLRQPAGRGRACSTRSVPAGALSSSASRWSRSPTT